MSENPSLDRFAAMIWFAKRRLPGGALNETDRKGMVRRALSFGLTQAQAEDVMGREQADFSARILAALEGGEV